MNKMAAKWLMGRTCWTKGWFTARAGQSRTVRFHHTTQNDVQFNTSELFIPGIIHLIVLGGCWLRVTETPEIKTTDKGGTGVTGFRPSTPNRTGVHCADHTAFSTYREHICNSILTPCSDLMEPMERKSARSIAQREAGGGSPRTGKPGEQRETQKEHSSCKRSQHG